MAARQLLELLGHMLICRRWISRVDSFANVSLFNNALGPTMAICFPGSQFIARSELIAKNCVYMHPPPAAAAAYALHAASAAATMADRIVGVWIYIHTYIEELVCIYYTDALACIQS